MNKKRALVVEDSTTTRHIIARILRELGFEVLEAHDGLDALERLRDITPPELALVDWNMPRLDGLAFVRAVRADSHFDRMRLMMITTENDLQHVSKAIQAGADEYLMKPFTPEMVFEKLAIIGVSARA